MGLVIQTETETVIKKILPYLRRRGYDVEKDLDFETAIQLTDRYAKGYVDILVTCGTTKPMFLIEAKKASKALTEKDRNQAIEYGTALKLQFVVVTNGSDIRSYNVETKAPIKWNGKLTQKIPTRDQLNRALSVLKVERKASDIPLGADESLPFRPGLPLKQLNALFARCHNAIRKFEKNEDNAFADFSKILFLKLLEEKADSDSEFRLPYSYRFHELADKPESESDQISTAIIDMIRKIKDSTPYGEVLEDPLRLRNPRTFRYTVQQLANVSFQDSSLDAKGAAFEYFVRATLKGKHLGQYFTPRALVEFMSCLVGREKILNALMIGDKPKVLDPACGTGGFLIFLMQENLRMLNDKLKSRAINQTTYDTLAKKIKQEVFFGSDANQAVACAAKMNMIIAGDGHSNIKAEDSLARAAQNWNIETPNCHIILTNPPFGTSESYSLTPDDLAQYAFRRTKGQLLFVQKMVLATYSEGEICTVIDEGMLNTDTAKEIRRWLFEKCQVVAIVSLPEDTFKPNKINVKSSLLYLKRRSTDDIDLEHNYKVTFCSVDSFGYLGSGDSIRGFNFKALLDETSTNMIDTTLGEQRTGYHWTAFDIDAQIILADETCRLDYKYWHPEIRYKMEELQELGSLTIKDYNLIETRRGHSPSAELYVDETDGYARVIKAGSNISKYGELIEEGDFIEKNIYDEMENVWVQDGDILLASTGDGTLGKCCVYHSKTPAIADGHVTIIRVDQDKIYPEYLCDYLRIGLGAQQIDRFYTGSTGLIELTPAHVNSIVVKLPSTRDEQIAHSEILRTQEKKFLQISQESSLALESAWKWFSDL